MILQDKDLQGSISDRPEYSDGYDNNNSAFQREFEELKQLAPQHGGWSGALYSFEIYKGPEGYRIAMPAKYHPFEVKGARYFEGYLLSKTVFPNPYQARQIAARIVHRMMGY